MVRTGFRFCPTDEELIEILHHKVSGNTTAMASFDFIVERNIYDFEPQDLLHYCPPGGSESVVGLNKKERYYYCKRKSDSREVMGRGWWKATSHVKAISWGNNINGDQVIKGYKRPLTFHRFKDNNNLRNRKDAVKTDWIMHEYGLQSIPTEWRLCKIKYKGKEKLKEDIISVENNNIINNTTPSTTPLMSLEAEDGSSSSFISMNISPMHLDFAFEQPPSLPVNDNNVNYHDNYCWSNSNIMFDDDHQFAQLDTLLDQSFPDLWSWDN